MTTRLKKFTSILIITVFIFGWIGEVLPKTIFANEELNNLSNNPVVNVATDVYNPGSELDKPLSVKTSVYDEVYGVQGTFIELKGNEMPKTVIGDVYGAENNMNVTNQVYGNTDLLETGSVRSDVYHDDTETPNFSDLLSLKMAVAKPRVLSEQAPVYDKTKFSEAPYSVENNGESISTLTGSLSLESTDMVLPGRNGLGFALKRQYNTSDSQFYDMDVLDNSYDQSIYKYWTNFNAVKKRIIPQYNVEYTEKRWKQFDYGNDGSVDQETGYQYVKQTKGPYNSEAEARSAAAKLRTYQIADDHKRVNDYRTSSRSSYFSGSVFYSKNGYSGMLYTSGAPYSISGSYSPGGSKKVTDSCENKIPGKYNARGVWVATGSGSPCSGSKYYSSNGYTGYLYRVSDETLKACPSPNRRLAGYPCTKSFKANYSGTVTKPTVDTRTWRQEYSGTITKPGYTSSVGYSSWKYDGSGNVTRDAFTLEGTAEVKTFYKEGPAENIRLSESFDDMSEAEAYAALLNGLPNGQLFGRQNGYNFYLSNPGAYVYVETIGQYRVNMYRNQVTKPARDTQYPLGKGWSWELPYVVNKDQKTYIHPMEGGSYEIQGTSLKGYPWKGLSFTADTSVTVNGEGSSHVLSTITGAWKQYFSADGRLLQITDNHNNQIQFMYSKDASGVPLLTTVRDAVGNAIQIHYSSTDITLSKGNERVIYHKHQEQNVDLLDGVTDAKGRRTSYSYLLANAGFNLLSFDASRGKSNPYALLTKIQHPTGASTEYTYENSPVKRYMGVSSFNEAYRLKTRKDQMLSERGTNEEFNRKTVFYNGDMGSSYQKNIQFSTALDNGLTVSTYNYKKSFVDTNTSEQYYLESSIVKADQVEKTTSFSYGKRVSGSNYDAPEPTTTRTTSNVNGDTSVTNIEYDDYGNVTQSSDETGASTTNTYDDKQRLKTTRESADTNASLYTEFVRNAFGDVTEQTIRRDHAAGELLQHIKYDGIDEYGNVTSQTIYNGDKQITTRTEYGSQYAGAYPTSQSVRVTDADGKKSVVRKSSEYELSTGRIIASTDGKNQRTAYQYDMLGRVTKVVLPDAKTLEVAYDDDDNSVTVKNEAGVQTRTKWNALGWKTEEGYLNRQGYQIQSKLSYDSFGRLDSNTDALGNITKYFYDNWSRPTETGYADGSNSRVLYNDANRTVSRVDAENYQTIETYDMWGRKSKTEEKAPADTTSRLLSKQSYDKISGNVLINWDGNNNKTSYTYDSLGQLNSVTNAKGETTQYSFDLMGNPVAVTYADGSQKRKEFDELGQVIKVTDGKNQITKQYYDENGNLIRRVDRNGQTTRYEYDAHNRLLQRVSKDETVGYTYDATGKRTSMTDSTGITSYQYDPYTEQLVKVIFPDGLLLKNQYDANGNRIKMKEPFGSEVSYTYDTRNRLTSAGTDPSSPDTKYTYYKNGLLEQMIGFNGLKHQFQYAGMDLARLNVNQGEQTVDDFKYTRDGSKNIVKREQKSLVEQEETTDLFQYDVLNRVVGSSEYKASYEYDTRGNRQTLTTERPLKTVPSEYSYDAENRLTQVRKNGKNVQYMYNGDGLLVGRIEGGVQTRYYYDGDQMIAEATVENGTPKLKARYIRGQKLEAIQYADGTKAYPIYNGHGDIVELRDSKGNVLNTYNYDIWGNIASSQEKVYNPFRYSGELWDSTTELQYLRARWYDPDSGRFINEDTYEGQIDNPLSLNLYSYVHNNPLIYTDPTGHKVWLIHGTWSDGSTWTDDFVNYAENLFHEKSEKLNWSGGNTKGARSYAAEDFVNKVYKWHKQNPNDPIRLVGHSHGGNVAIMLTNLLAKKGMKVKTLITIATPVREYQLETKVGQHIQMYNNQDYVQSDLGGHWWAFWYTSTREFKGADNVRAKDAENNSRIAAHSAMHSNVAIWKKYIEPILKLK